jgi:phospholipid/cholesterol/gamma-HCH transport system permease protein
MIANVTAIVGKNILKLLRINGEFAKFTSSTFRFLFTPPFRIHETFYQMRFIGLKSLPIANITALFVGMVLVLQTGYQLNKFGAKLYVAGISAIALAREMIPVFTAIVVGSRVGASITAELGTMQVSEQIDAMESLAVNPIKYLVVPRFIASVLMLPVITIYADVTGFVGGLIIGNTSLNISVRMYINNTTTLLLRSDFFAGVMKTFVFGAIIALVGCYYGFKTEGGAEGVGKSTTTSVVVTIVLILIVNYILSAWLLSLKAFM